MKDDDAEGQDFTHIKLVHGVIWRDEASVVSAARHLWGMGTTHFLSSMS